MISSMKAKYFTPEEASELVPEVEKRLREVTIANEAVAQLTADVEESVKADANILEFMEIKRRLNKALSDLHRSVEYLEDLGCTLKDLEHGLVDFPAKRFGEEVWLCWRVGEAKVSFWHGKREGFAMRKPLEADFSELA
jgi:hypothetical protein